MSEQVKYSIVIPCYKSSATIRKVVELSMEELKGEKTEFVLVNDCAPDDGATLTELISLSKEYENVLVIDLAKNTGQHNAIMAGLNHVNGEYVIAMDDDMQTHPSQIHKLIEEIQKGYDVVYAYYPKKKHAWYRNIGSAINFWTVRKLIGKPKNLKTSSFWIARRFVCRSLIEYKNSYAYLQGLFLRTTGNIGNVPVQHFEREVGNSTYTLKTLVKLWSNIIGYSVIPLRMASLLGFVFSVISIVSAIGLVIRKFFFHIDAVGWTSMMVAMCFFSGILLMFMGLIGEYIGRMFMASNNEPQYVIREIYGDNE